MKSLEAFEENIKATDIFTARIHAISTYLKPKLPAEYPKSIPAHVIKFVSFDESHFEKIFESGFIALFANFEYFMYEFLKELYTKYPQSIPTEKTIRAEDILNFKSYKSVHDFLIDMVSVENSYDIEVWNTTAHKQFNLKPMSEDVKIRLMIMNSMRNLLLHSGGHWNSKAHKDSRKIEKAMVSNNMPIKSKNGKAKKEAFKTAKPGITPQIAYSTTIACFREIIKDLKSQIEKKNKRRKTKK